MHNLRVTSKLNKKMKKIKMIYLDFFDRKLKVKYFSNALMATRFKEKNRINVKVYKRIAY